MKLLSNELDIPTDLHIFNSDAKTIIFNSILSEVKNNVTFVKIDWNNKTQEVLDYCFKNGIASIIIEGGTNTINNFMNLNAWDEARVFINPTKKFEHGIVAPKINLNNSILVDSGSDLLHIILNT